MMSRWLRRALRLGVIALVVGCLMLLLRRLDWAKHGDAIRHAKICPLVIAGALTFVCLWGKAMCWRIMLAPRFTVPTRRLLRYTIVAFAASALAPARAGEALRMWALKHREGVPVADTAAVLVAEKLLDGVAMLLLIAPLPWIVPGLPPWVARAIVVGAAVAFAALAVLSIAVGHILARTADGPASWFARFLAGMHVLRSPRRVTLSMVVLLFVWCVDLAMVEVVLYAIGIDLPVGSALFVLFALNVAILIPSTPAQVGALEVGAMAGLQLLDVPSEPALAFAILYHALQILPLVAIGLALEWRLVLGRASRPTGPGLHARPT